MLKGVGGTPEPDHYGAMASSVSSELGDDAEEGLSIEEAGLRNGESGLWWHDTTGTQGRRPIKDGEVGDRGARVRRRRGAWGQSWLGDGDAWWRGLGMEAAERLRD